MVMDCHKEKKIKTPRYIASLALLRQIVFEPLKDINLLQLPQYLKPWVCLWEYESIGFFIGIHIPKSITQDTTMLIQMFLKFKAMF